jgi:hypothetical protein
MNSLHELNDYGDEELITTDERATILTWAAVAGYDGSTALTQTQDEGASLVMKLGYDATFMQSIPATFVYIIDVSYAGGNVTPTWNSLPDGVTVTSAANVYTVHGIGSIGENGTGRRTEKSQGSVPGRMRNRPALQRLLHTPNYLSF